MAQTTTTKRSAAAAAINTDTVIVTPAIGQRVKALLFQVVNEIAAQAAGMAFELRWGVGGPVIAVVGYDSAAAPIGQTTKPMPLAHEVIGDGATPFVGRNLTALAATSTAAYVLTTDAGYVPTS